MTIKDFLRKLSARPTYEELKEFTKCGGCWETFKNDDDKCDGWHYRPICKKCAKSQALVDLTFFGPFALIAIYLIIVSFLKGK